MEKKNDDMLFRMWRRTWVWQGRLGLPHTDDPWVRLMQGKGCNRARSAILPGRGLMYRQGARRYWWGKGRIPSGYMSFQIWYTPAGLIFLKSRVRGYGRLGDAFRDHREI